MSRTAVCRGAGLRCRPSPTLPPPRCGRTGDAESRGRAPAAGGASQLWLFDDVPHGWQIQVPLVHGRAPPLDAPRPRSSCRMSRMQRTRSSVTSHRRVPLTSSRGDPRREGVSGRRQSHPVTMCNRRNERHPDRRCVGATDLTRIAGPARAATRRFAGRCRTSRCFVRSRPLLSTRLVSVLRWIVHVEMLGRWPATAVVAPACSIRIPSRAASRCSGSRRRLAIRFSRS